MSVEFSLAAASSFLEKPAATLFRRVEIHRIETLSSSFCQNKTAAFNGAGSLAAYLPESLFISQKLLMHDVLAALSDAGGLWGI